MAAIVAAGASLLGSQRSRRPRLSRSCSGSAAIQSRPGWLAVQPARRQCDGRHPRQSVCIAARWACWLQKQVSIVPQFESAALDRACRTAPVASIWWGRNREQISPWPFGRERFTAVPTGIGGCWAAILIPLGCSSGTNLTFPQVAKSPILRSEPFSSRLATDRRSKNSCA